MKAEPLDTNDEAYLVKCCKNNNPIAQKTLYSKYVEAMLLVCLRYVADKEDAREVLMDGFLKFFQNIGSFTYRGEGSVKAWLKQIMVNQCLMQLRKSRHLLISDKELTKYEYIDAGEDIVDELAAKDLVKLVYTLPDGYRTVFNLYVFEGMNHREIGKLLDISEGTSKSQLHRAKAMLKEKIMSAK